MVGLDAAGKTTILYKLKLGEVVTPGFPEFLGGQTATIIPPKDGESSGRRLALAKWITDPENPRTARVLVNRLWQHIFGSPLVGTPNDFGAFGLPPSHPRLLDAMATELVTNGWSMKYMIRQLVTSTAFRMSGEYNPLSAQLDPANELYWRFSGRRLSAEELRDSILAVSGNLNLKTSGPSVYPPLPKEVLSTSSRPGRLSRRGVGTQAGGPIRQSRSADPPRYSRPGMSFLCLTTIPYYWILGCIIN